MASASAASRMQPWARRPLQRPGWRWRVEASPAGAGVAAAAPATEPASTAAGSQCRHAERWRRRLPRRIRRRIGNDDLFLCNCWGIYDLCFFHMWFVWNFRDLCFEGYVLDGSMVIVCETSMICFGSMVVSCVKLLWFALDWWWSRGDGSRGWQGTAQCIEPPFFFGFLGSQRCWFLNRHLWIFTSALPPWCQLEKPAPMWDSQPALMWFIVVV